MPSSITVSHNNLKMTFKESDHSYIDSKGKKYTSVTTLVGYGFEKFDAETIAKKKAERTGENWHELVSKWKNAGTMAANAGTRLHENCEHQILGKNDLLHEAIDINEKIHFELARQEVDRIKANHHNIKFEPEKLVFSPRLGLAGSVDLLVTKDDGTYTIYDWKNIKKIDKFGFRGKCGILECTKDVQDSNFWHYALQLQLYELILKAEHYIENGAKVDRILNVFENNKLVHYELPDMMTTVKGLIKWYHTER